MQTKWFDTPKPQNLDHITVRYSGSFGCMLRDARTEALGAGSVIVGRRCKAPSFDPQLLSACALSLSAKTSSLNPNPEPLLVNYIDCTIGRLWGIRSRSWPRVPSVPGRQKRHSSHQRSFVHFGLPFSSGTRLKTFPTTLFF